MLVIEPLEDRLERIEPTIECEHKLRCWFLYICRGHGNLVFLDRLGCRMDETMMEACDEDSVLSSDSVIKRDPSRVTDSRL